MGLVRTSRDPTALLLLGCRLIKTYVRGTVPPAVAQSPPSGAVWLLPSERREGQLLAEILGRLALRSNRTCYLALARPTSARPPRLLASLGAITLATSEVEGTGERLTCEVTQVSSADMTACKAFLDWPFDAQICGAFLKADIESAVWKHWQSAATALCLLAASPSLRRLSGNSSILEAARDVLIGETLRRRNRPG